MDILQYEKKKLFIKYVMVGTLILKKMNERIVSRCAIHGDYVLTGTHNFKRYGKTWSQ